MKYAVIICRVLMGLAFVVFGANILHPFMPMEMPPADSLQMQFMNVMAIQTKWMSVVGIFQLLGGLLVLSGRMTPLGLVFLAPVLVNILSFHLFLDGGHGIGAGLVFSVLEIFLIYAYRANFQGVFATNATPTV